MSVIEDSPDTNAATAAAAPTQTPLEIWRTFDLNGRRAELDKHGLDIADRMEQSQASRKQLTSATRSLRSSMADGSNVPKKDYISLLKSYQMEVDALTTRAKLAETVFLSLYKDLYEAPDPVEELTRAAANVRRVTELERANEALEKERGDLAERNTVVSKYEKRITDWQAAIDAARNRFSEETSAKIEEKQAEWMAAQQKTMEAYELREQELLHQLRISSDHTHRLETASDDLQRKLNDATSQLEAMKSSQANVSEMAVEDLERTRAEVKNLRTRCLDLENMLSHREEGNVDSDDTISRSALSAELAARDVEVSQLHDQVSALEELLGGKDQEKSKEFAKLTSAIQEKDRKLAELNEELSKFPAFEEYQTMVQQFETLQSFQLMEENETDDVTGATSEAGGSRDAMKTSNTLERRLLEKVKTLEGKITRMRVDIGEKDGEIGELRAQLRSNEEQIGDQKMLISNLEGSISAMTSENVGAFGSRRTTGRTTESGNLFRSAEAITSGEGKEDSAWEWGERQQAESLHSIIREEPSMLDIVAGQRDRFRARTMELEEDNRKLMERIEKLTSDLDSLKSDNVRLYERIRFLQSYQQSGGNLGKTSNGMPSTDSHQAISIGDDEDSRGFLGKYRSMYEDMVNPYTIFNRRERHKRMSEMSAPERLTLRASQRALSTRTSRLIVFFYIILLHVLVALVLGFSPASCDQNVTTKAQH